MKKNIFACIFMFLVIGSTFAQQKANPYRPKIDSIQHLLNRNAVEDTLKVKQLNRLALICFFDLQYKRGLIAASEARQLSKKLNFNKGEGLFMRTMAGFFHNRIEDFEIRTRWFFKGIGKKEERVNLGVFPPKDFDLAKANLSLLDALQYFEKTDDKGIVASILLSLVKNHTELNNVNEALMYANRAIPLFKELNQNVSAFNILVYKLYILEKNGRTKEAKEAEIEANIIISKNENNEELAFLTEAMGQKYAAQGRDALSIEYHLKTIKALEAIGDKEMLIGVLTNLGNQYEGLSLSKKSLDCFKKIIELKDEQKIYENIENDYIRIAFRLIDLKEFDEAKTYLSKAKSRIDTNNNPVNMAQYNDAIGQLLMAQAKYTEALPHFFESLNLFKNFQGRDFSYFINLNVAKCYQKLSEISKSIEFGLKSYEGGLSNHNDKVIIQSSLLLSENYEQVGKPNLAYQYLKKFHELTNEKEKQDIANQLADLEIKSVVEKSILEKERNEKENQNQQWLIYTIGGALFCALVLMFLLYRNIKNKQRANAVLENTLTQLKTTQNQLIQSEKLASLGELTAGIAHEIQNPLNFVTNFSEVSGEMLHEMEIELGKGEIEEAKAIAGDLKQNLERINHHGTRASSIVKGMLEHSKTNSGSKEQTDINALADEYLRLVYHGLRAKDNAFNSDFKAYFDKNLPKIEVIPQEIGRVLLNLINNAFYAAYESKKPNPIVTVSTKLISSSEGQGWVSITVKDNGNGMSEATKAKIFQPFFTTKPTGQGTGLGLSLAYDIVNKGHGGKIEVESVEGEGTEFIVKLQI